METIHSRLKSLRKAAGLSMEAVADALGIKSWQTIQQWEKEPDGTSPNRKRLEAVASLYGTTVEYLVTGARGHVTQKGRAVYDGHSAVVLDTRGSEASNPMVLTNDSTVFNLLDVRAACGEGAINTEYPEIVRSLVMSPEEAQRLIGSVNRSGSIQIIVANKDSMMPTIQPDDLLFVDTAVKDYAGEAIYILRHGGELICKRLSLVGATLTVSSDNAMYPSWAWGDRPDETVIVGRVVRALPMTFKKFGSI